MSCITEIIKRKGTKDFLRAGKHAIETGGTYRGYEWMVTLTSNCGRCGYVAIPKGHPLYEGDLTSDKLPKPYQDVEEPHGGITFHKSGKHIIQHVLGDFHCDDVWLGFDAMHSLDAQDYETAKHYFKDDDLTIHMIKTQQEIHERVSRDHPISDPDWIDTIKSKEYMIGHCISFIDQITNVEGERQHA